MRRMLDLYAGLGGASEAFVRAGWLVDRLENNELITDPLSKFYVDGITHQDILTWDYRQLPVGYYDFIWASPPCLEFSDAIHSPRSRARNRGEEYEPDLTLALKAKEIIEYFNPGFWCVENVRGARKEFTRIFGPPWQIMMPFFFWGKFPFIPEIKHSKHSVDKGSNNPLRANFRGKIPLGISQAFLNEIELQTTLEKWLS